MNTNLTATDWAIIRTALLVRAEQNAMWAREAEQAGKPTDVVHHRTVEVECRLLHKKLQGVV